jgi:hypothetical protein
MFPRCLNPQEPFRLGGLRTKRPADDAGKADLPPDLTTHLILNLLDPALGLVWMMAQCRPLVGPLEFLLRGCGHRPKNVVRRLDSAHPIRQLLGVRSTLAPEKHTRVSEAGRDGGNNSGILSHAAHKAP